MTDHDARLCCRITFALTDWIEEQQEEAEIRHLRHQIHANRRMGVMGAY